MSDVHIELTSANSC